MQSLSLTPQRFCSLWDTYIWHKWCEQTWDTYIWHKWREQTWDTYIWHKWCKQTCLLHKVLAVSFFKACKWHTEWEILLRLSRSVALGTFGALTKPKSAANYLPYASKVALGTSGQCSTQASNQSSGAMWKPRWTSWASRPNEPYGFCGRKATLNHAHALVTVCP